MKLIDRIRPIADMTAYAEFAAAWRAFFEAGQNGTAADVAQMIQLGNWLHRQVVIHAAEHAKAQVRSPFSLTEPQADQLLLEARRGGERAMRKVLPELAAYADFIESTLRDRTVRPPMPVEAML